jgi:predicted site-specific integrase-resolvase
MLSIKKAGMLLGVTPKTLRVWEKEGKLFSYKTKGGHRRYLESDLLGVSEFKKLTVCYARVSSHGQKEDLKRQEHLLELYCAKNGYTFKLISDLGSGLNYRKKGLLKLLNLICTNKIDRLIITHKDRLLRFGSELIFDLCKQFKIEVVIINETENLSFEEELASDVLEIITVFSAKLYGSRSHKNKKIIKKLKEISKEIR